MGDVILTSLKEIKSEQGNILHAMKKSDVGFREFGEAYFSAVNQNVIKGWKKHLKMTLNLIVPVGKIQFVIYNEISKEFCSHILSKSNYHRLTIGPNLWVAFKGIEKDNMLLNIASLEHDPSESISLELDDLKYDW